MWSVAVALGALFFVQSESEQALALYKQHKYGEAAQAFERVVTADGGGGDTLLLLGHSYFLAGQYAKSIPWLEKASAGSARTTECSYMLATAYVLTQQPERAVAPFADVFGFSRDSAAAHLAAGQMMIRQELLDYAEKQVRRALELDSRIPQAHFELGVIALAHADIDGGVTEFQREIAINPSFAMAYYRLGDAYSRREEWDHAIPTLQRSIWFNPSYSGPYILLGKAYLKKDDLVNAEGMLRRAIQMDTQNRSAHYLLGQTLIREGHTGEGKKFLERSLQLGADTGK